MSFSFVGTKVEQMAVKDKILFRAGGRARAAVTNNHHHPRLLRRSRPRCATPLYLDSGPSALRPSKADPHLQTSLPVEGGGHGLQ
jgi:hypothetical protein